MVLMQGRAPRCVGGVHSPAARDRRRQGKAAAVPGRHPGTPRFGRPGVASRICQELGIHLEDRGRQGRHLMSSSLDGLSSLGNGCT